MIGACHPASCVLEFEDLPCETIMVSQPFFAASSRNIFSK